MVNIPRPDPGAAKLDGAKVAAAPAGSPVMEKVVAALNPPLMLHVKLVEALLPARTGRELESAAT
jgi:hypothetical protein